MTGARACGECLRRSWLIGRLSARLDYRSRDPQRLIELLALDDEEIVAALAGRHREALGEEWASFEPPTTTTEDVQGICRHDTGYPSGIAGDGAPRMVHVADGVDRLIALSSAPTVAIVGSRRATDYGMEMGKSLARGLAASGLTVASELADGIAAAAHAGALEVDGGTIAAMPGGLDVACPARWRGLYRRVRARGCAVSELPCGSPPRHWGQTASGRIVAGLAELTIVVEAGDGPGELLGANLARSLDRTVAAVPGRVTSPASRGTHRLLMEGAALVRGPEDALELLGRTIPGRTIPGDTTPGRTISGRTILGQRTPGMTTPGRTPPDRTARNSTVEADRSAIIEELEPLLKRTLEAVGAGRDTAAKLAAGEADASETLLALSELELAGLLARGDGGRYVPRQSAVPS